jgi:lantibiotic modifying enzyme
MLHDPGSHEPLVDGAWNAAVAEAAIRVIARDADDALRDADWWPLHPLDDDGATPTAIHGIYFGAAGVLLALDRLARGGLHEPRHDYAALAQHVLDSYRRRPEFGGPAPSIWIGEGGIALVAWLLAPSPALADRLAELAQVPEPDTLELLWGSPGLLLIADVMLERTGEDRWRAAWLTLAEHLLARWGEHVPDFWTQDLYGRTSELVGAGHGLAGVVAALARRPELLSHDHLLARTVAALSATAVRDGDEANWPARAGGPLADGANPIRTQWCHGAPGIVTSAAALPRDDALDDLLLAGGELTWAAGPLRKGPGLCHGSAGNGFAFLKLFERTQDERWLERARRFAVHAAAQVEATRREHGRGRYSLWTGDLGAAIYLHRCLAGGSGMPGLDAW